MADSKDTKAYYEGGIYEKDNSSRDYASPERTETLDTDQHHSLHRGLKARHMTMIAIGGAIGTGLIIGTGQALATGGPGSILIAYASVGVLVFVIMSALGEMCTWLPQASSFSGYAARFVDPAMGFTVGWMYLFKYLITTPNQLTAAALVIQEWLPATRLNPGVFITVFLVLIVFINYFGIKFFGEFEFWLSSFKVVVILGIILLSIILAAGGGPNGGVKGFYYWSNPGAFAPYTGIQNQSLAKFVAFWSCMVTAVFAFLGTELIAITVGEAQNPRRTIPKAIKLTFYRILVFYICSVFLLGMLVPYNSTDLATASKKNTGASASPYVLAIRIAGIQALPTILNACILMFVISASNSDLYIGSRTLYGLAREGNAPKVFAWTDKRGVPVPALALCSVVCCIAYLNCSTDSTQVFRYFVNLVTIFGLLTWITILLTHIRFIKARKAQGITDDQMPYVAPFGVTGSAIGLAFATLIAFTKNFTVFIGPVFDYKTFITAYLGLPLYFIFFFGYKFWKKTKWVPLEEADFYTGKDKIDREEARFLEEKARKEELLQREGGFKWIYSRFIGLVF